MTARDRLLGVRRQLVAAIAARAMLVAVAAALLSLALARAAGHDTLAVSLGVVVGLAGALVMLAPLRYVRSLERVALWVEEGRPSLRYAVVSIAEGRGTEALEAQALETPWWSDARRRAVRTLVFPAVAAALAVLLLLALPMLGRARGGAATRAVAGGGGGSTPADPLARVRVTITPPSYSGRPATSASDPTSVDGLVASGITVRGEGDGSEVTAALDSLARRVVRNDGGGWSVSLAMPARPALLHLRARNGGTRERLIVLAPVVDAPPVVTLLLPVRDTVVRAAAGTLLLRAQLRDDIGLHDARFEIVVSSGQDENFTFRSTTIASVRLGNALERVLVGRLSLDSLALTPGDVLQLRAVARDANTASGPGVGSSDTRALRVARAGEYDSVSVEAAPPGEPEGQVLSQRMLITLTEALDRRRRGLARATLLDESRRIATDQARLRKRVGDIVFQRLGGEPLAEETGGAASSGGKLSPDDLLKRAEEATRGSVGEVMDVEGDETPILAINKPLLEAFNAMWDAGRALEQGETDRALPPMRRALAAIERARRAERIYLRGRPAAVVVDVAKARLAGKEKGASSTLEPRAARTSDGRRRAASFARASELLARDPSAAADTLLVMRVDALVREPALAAALDDAARAVRRGDAGAIALAWPRVRRLIGSPPVRGEASALWSGVP